MIEADVWRAIFATLRTGLDSQGLNKVKTKQSHQPKHQGANTEPTVYLFKVTSVRLGSQGRKYNHNEQNQNFDEIENYWIAQTFQLSGLVKTDINDEDALTAYDVVEKCAAILQTRNSRQLLLQSGIGIERITDVRSPYSTDDKDEFDQDASFDFVLTYNQTIESTTPQVTTIEPAINQVG